MEGLFEMPFVVGVLSLFYAAVILFLPLIFRARKCNSVIILLSDSWFLIF